ncbi:MAG: ParD-like family protein [Pseudomonadales bacterium]|nr:ParD-like family protein [Pseudomonadales bacterium]
MAKAASPVRLQNELMQAATSAGKRMHRSAAEQVEYWASIGRSVAKVVDPDTLLEVSAGLAQLKIVPVISPTIDPDELFSAMEQERKAGTLAAAVSGSVISGSTVRYQASTEHPGQLEQINPDGSVIIGQFSMGVFAPQIKE